MIDIIFVDINSDGTVLKQQKCVLYKDYCAEIARLTAKIKVLEESLSKALNQIIGGRC
jgi:hypothetical protein